MAALKADIDRPLSAILTLNTIAHTMGAAGAGAQYAREFGAGTEAVFAGVLTLAILVFTEIIPKTIGARFALQLAPGTSWFLPKLQWVLGPLVWLCGQVTRLVTFGRASASPMHREELLAMARLGEQEGALKSSETTIVRNILQLRELTAGDIMTPRSVMFMLPDRMPIVEFASEIRDKPFSRIPLVTEDTGEIESMVLRADALMSSVLGHEGVLADLKRPVGATPSSVHVDRLFEQMLSERHHLMLVRDEFGTTVGLVTLEDVLETIVGVEIVDEHDEVEDLQVLARRRWSERARRMGLVMPSEITPDSKD
jgi:CBS domain containing-hemolysin-like protein